MTSVRLSFEGGREERQIEAFSKASQVQRALFSLSFGKFDKTQTCMSCNGADGE